MDRQELEEVVRDLLTMSLDALHEMDIALQGQDGELTEDDIDILQQLSWETDYLADTARRFLYE